MNAIETHRLTKYYGKSRGSSISTRPSKKARFFDILGEENGRGAKVSFSSHTLSEVQ